MKKVSIIGGSGFVGRAVCIALADRGYSVRVISRQNILTDEFEWRRYDSSKLSSLIPVVAGSDAVINLVGILNSRLFRSEDFFDAHVRLTLKILEACHFNHVTRYLHMSALNASTDAPSEYLRTKGESENIAHNDAKMRTTSFQPSVIFGPGDGLLNRFVKILKYAPPVLPLACAHTMFAPVYIGDVATAVADSIDDKAAGQRVRLCGPEHLTLGEIVNYVAGLIHRRIHVIALPDPLARLQAQIGELIPGKPFSLDNYRSLQLDSICTNAEPCLTRLSEVGHNCIS